MKIIKRKLTSLECNYPLEKFGPKEDILFLDIETTGFTARSSLLYLIGCVYYQEDSFQLIQWFAEKDSEEEKLLVAFFDFAKDYHTLIHFNGNRFDIPYLQQKCELLELPYSFEGFLGIDILCRISPLKQFLKLPNCKQKTIESYLGILRDDTFGGGELISVYHDFLNSPTEFALDTLLLHNADDIQGMVSILPILAYVDLYQCAPRVTKVNANFYKDFQNETRSELVMKLSLTTPLPVSVSNYSEGCFFSGFGEEATLKVPLFCGELKYFYSNYKDYYYLPAEDTALHKSVAGFVDKTHRERATAATCYTRQLSRYLPEWEPIFTPIFKATYDSNETYFELNDSMKQDREAFSKYAAHILQMMTGIKKEPQD